MRLLLRILLFSFLFPLCCYGQSQDETIKLQISGAGPSTEVIKFLAKEFHEQYPHIEIDVPERSIKHRGAIAWTTHRWQLFGRLGRPLSEYDLHFFPRAREIPVAKVRLAFAVGKNLILPRISMEQLKDIYTGQIANWKEVGGPDKKIILLGREKGESSLAFLQKDYPFFSEARFHKIFKKDHLMIRGIAHVPGAIGFAARSNLLANDDIAVLHIDNFRSGQQVGLVYDVSNDQNDIVQLMKKFVQNKRWRRALIDNDFLPLDN
ncbi:MAG: substrate-binding domain-containing protein [Desulfobulbaceae bacterium]|nr:substrate-binding domain-containing protein [Desulfobulbaceae bacterium]